MLGRSLIAYLGCFAESRQLPKRAVLRKLKLLISLRLNVFASLAPLT